MSKDTVQSYVAEWKRKRFRDTDLSLERVVQSIGTDNPLAEARPGPGYKWIMYNIEGNKSALLTHVGVYLWGTDLDTGNFVPDGEQAPNGLADNRIQMEMSHKCEYSYAFDTSEDDSLYRCLQALEDHVAGHREFNKAKRPRSAWQYAGSDPNVPPPKRYVMVAKIFTRKPNVEVKIPYDVHHWIANAVERQTEKRYIPNPDKPKLLEYHKNKLRTLQSSPNPVFKKGDIIWMSFKVLFSVGSDSWSSEIIPVEFIRVDRLPENMLAQADNSGYLSMLADVAELAVGRTLFLLEDSEETRKRKRVDDVSDEETLSGTSISDVREEEGVNSPPSKRREIKSDGIPASDEGGDKHIALSVSKRKSGRSRG